MDSSEIMRDQIFEIIANQLKANDPPETQATFDRLIKQGFNDFQTRQMIGQCISVEMFEIMKTKTPFNLDRYVKHLNALPKEPFD